ncbi:hypothetical protein ACET3Z_013683 [Daucus carota]
MPIFRVSTNVPFRDGVEEFILVVCERIEKYIDAKGVDPDEEETMEPAAIPAADIPAADSEKDRRYLKSHWHPLLVYLQVVISKMQIHGLYIVHFAATKDGLLQHFNKFGDVLKVIIVTDATTGQPKGSAYVEFTKSKEAEHALSLLDGTSFLSRILKVVKESAAPQEAAIVTLRPQIFRGSIFAASWFGRVPFPRRIPSLYQARPPVKASAKGASSGRGVLKWLPWNPVFQPTTFHSSPPLEVSDMSEQKSTKWEF